MSNTTMIDVNAQSIYFVLDTVLSTFFVSDFHIRFSREPIKQVKQLKPTSQAFSYEMAECQSDQDYYVLNCHITISLLAVLIM